MHRTSICLVGSLGLARASKLFLPQNATNLVNTLQEHRWCLWPRPSPFSHWAGVAGWSNFRRSTQYFVVSLTSKPGACACATQRFRPSTISGKRSYLHPMPYRSVLCISWQSNAHLGPVTSFRWADVRGSPPTMIQWFGQDHLAESLACLHDRTGKLLEGF